MSVSKQLGRILIGLFLILSVPATASFAHVRKYVWTQGYETLPKGEFELESFVTLKVPDGDVSREHSWEYQEELEYGVTDHLNIAHYERWETQNVVGPDDSTVYKGFKFEAKYRVGEKGKYWVDPLIYVEWITNPRERHEDKNPNEIELKLILAKDFGKFNITYNQIMESQFGRGGRTKQEFAVAASYEVISEFRIGAEFTGQYWAPGSHRNELSLGPTLSWENRWFWIAAGARFGLNHVADDVEARVIVGVPF